MFRLMSIIFSMAATALMGAAVVVVLTMGHVTLPAILIAAALGLVAAVPVSWLIAREISA